MVAGFVTTPIDVIKTRMMVNTIRQYETKPLEWAVNIWRHEGMRGLFKGWHVRTLYLGIGGMLYFGIYVLMLKFFKVDKEYLRFRG